MVQPVPLNGTPQFEKCFIRYSYELNSCGG